MTEDRWQKVILARIAVFLFIFAPVLNVGLGPYGDTLSLLCLFTFFYYSYSLLKKPEPVLRGAKTLALIIALLIAYGLISGLLFSSRIGSFQVALRPFRALIMFCGLYCFMMIYARAFRNRLSETIIYDVFLAIGFHALIMAIEFFSPQFRDAIYAYTFADKMDPYNQMFRMAGLTNGGGAQISLFQSFGVVLWPLVIVNQPRFLGRLFSSIVAILILVSVILSGRSGIIFIIVMLPVVTLFAIRKGGLLGVLESTARLAIVCIVVVGGLYAVGDSEFIGNDYAYAQTAFDRTFDFLTFDGRVSEYGVVDDLTTQWLLPEDVKTFLVGDPYLFEASYLMENRIVDSDIGYVYYLFGYGLIGSLMHYAFYLCILLYASRYWRTDRPLAFISFIWATTILAFQAKENFALTRIGLSITTIFIVALFIKGSISSIGTRVPNCARPSN